MKRFFPIFELLKNYNRDLFQNDLVAGLTVGVMLIPQGMAYAMIAGLPPVYGLYASTLPLIIYALLGTSRQLAVGPVAMVSLLTASGIGAIHTGGMDQYILMAILLALMVGVFQLSMGILRLGFLVNFLSHPVISGFTSAAALIIGFSQLKHLLGVDLGKSQHIHEIVIEAFNRISEVNLPTLLVGLAGIILIAGLKKINSKIPGLLVTVILAILVVSMAGLTDLGVKVVGEIPTGLPAFTIPTVEFSLIKALIPTALVIGFVSFMESIAVAKAIQSKHKDYRISPNQELIALGASNIVGSFFQSYPTTGGFSRTAINDQAGAKTGMASIISAILIVLTLLFLTSLFYHLPNAILAAIIMVSVFRLIDVHEVSYLWRVKRTDFFMLLATFVATLGLGIEQGIGVGVILSLISIIYRTTKPHIALEGQVPGTHFYRNISRFDSVKDREDLLIFRFDAQLYFANTAFFRDELEKFAERKSTSLKAIIVNAECINAIDSSALHMLDELINQYAEDNIQFYFTGVKGPVRDVFSRSGLTEKIGNNHFFMSVQDAVDFHDNEDKSELSDGMKKFTLQSNDRR